jgi:RHS repeat-associated protein
MVLDENGQVKQALMYQPYGTVSDVQGITVAGNDPLRQKFTTKEFDEEGDENGAPGIDAYYFGARMYDPEIGAWNRPDPRDQYWNAYSYVGSNPVLLVDPNGEWGWVPGLVGGAAIGGAIGFAVGGLSGKGDWDWGRAWAGFGIGSVAGGLVGFGTSEHFQNFMASGIFKSNAQIANSMNQASELFILEQRLAQVNSEIAQLERCLANVGNPPPAVPYPTYDFSDLGRKWFDIKKISVLYEFTEAAKVLNSAFTAVDMVKNQIKTYDKPIINDEKSQTEKIRKLGNDYGKALDELGPLGPTRWITKKPGVQKK